MKKMMFDSLAHLLVLYPEEEAVRRAFQILDYTVWNLRHNLGVETDLVETILFGGKEYHRNDYVKVKNAVD